MVTIESKQNVYLNNDEMTLFSVRENGLYKGQFSCIGWDASDEDCILEYENRVDYSIFFDYCSE